MPFDRNFAQSLVAAMRDTGWITELPDGELSNPLEVAFLKHRETKRLIIHARRITPQGIEHNRPQDELHMQMIFDGDKRGRGKRNFLRFANSTQTVLFGFYQMLDSYVVAAYDPYIHHEYAYSKSLQVKMQTLEQAIRNGIAFQLRTSGETIVAFHIREIGEYLEQAETFHSLSENILSNMEDMPPEVKQVFHPISEKVTLPDLPIKDRKFAVISTGRFIRESRFALAIKRVYERCAICGFQYDDILDAAHIVPVAEGGTDTYDNGLGLCPTCHRMFDKGHILVNENGEIFINSRYAEVYQQAGKADSLENLRQSLRQYLWLPEDDRYHPSPENLRKTFLARR